MMVNFQIRIKGEYIAYYRSGFQPDKKKYLPFKNLSNETCFVKIGPVFTESIGNKVYVVNPKLNH
jgi:hypothetical protein